MKAKQIPKFKAGDVVQLRSGGEKMTVEIVLPYHKIHPAVGYVCVWMKDGCLTREEVSEAALCIIGRGRYGGTPFVEGEPD
jgi:uncharacterized protein YodC (DUF2158 family)